MEEKNTSMPKRKGSSRKRTTRRARTRSPADPKSYFINWDAVERARIAVRIEEKDLLDLSNVAKRTYQKIPKRPWGRETLRKIATELKSLPSALVDWERMVEEKKVVPDGLEAIRHYLDKDAIANKEPHHQQRYLLAETDYQDRKNVIRETSVCTTLLELSSVPSLADCVRSSAMFMPIDSQHKDYPNVPGTKYNHFFQVGAVLTCGPKTSRPPVIGYTRSPKEGFPHYTYTQGASILWGASYVFHDGRAEEPSIMDNWLADAICKPERAAEMFCNGSLAAPCTLLRLLSYKLRLRRLSPAIRPLGVITNDQRKQDGSGRAYTQYVFEVETPVSEEQATLDVLNVIEAPNLTPFLLRHDVDPEKVFSSADGKKNKMDIVAWQALKDRHASFLRYDSARFRRGFRII